MKCTHPNIKYISPGKPYCLTCLMFVAHKARAKSKFGNTRCEADGFKFPSLLERAYYYKYKKQVEDKELKYFLMQVPFHLPGAIKYYADFMLVANDDKITYVDVKGVETQVFINKKKQVEAIYNVKITIERK